MALSPVYKNSESAINEPYTAELDFRRRSQKSCVHCLKPGGIMQTRIQGTTMPVLEVQLDPNESVFSESGELSWITQSIQMTTHSQMGGGGGLFGVFKRMAGGGSIFMTEYRAFQYA